MTAGFLEYRSGERSSVAFHVVATGSDWDRKNAIAMRIIDPRALEQLRGDERLAIVTAGLRAAQRGVSANCDRCGVLSGNSLEIDGVHICEACTVQTALLACWTPDLEQVEPDVTLLTSLVFRGQCGVSGCEGGAAQDHVFIAYTSAADMVPKCCGCWRQAMLAVQHNYIPELSEEVDGPMLENLMGRAYEALCSVRLAAPAFGVAP